MALIGCVLRILAAFEIFYIFSEDAGTVKPEGVVVVVAYKLNNACQRLQLQPALLWTGELEDTLLRSSNGHGNISLFEPWLMIDDGAKDRRSYLIGAGAALSSERTVELQPGPP